MRIKHIVWIHFDRLSDAGKDGWRWKQTLSKPAWWEKRAKIIEKYTLKSLKNQSNQDFEIWCPFLPETLKDAVPMLEVLLKHNCQTTVDPDGSLCRLIDGHFDYLIQTWIDSDDMFRYDALQEIRDQELSPGLAMLYRQGHVLETSTGKIFRFSCPKNPPSMFSLVYTKNSLRNIQTLKEYQYKWRFWEKKHSYLIHHRLKFCPNKIFLHNNRFLATMTEANTSKKRGNQHAENHIGQEVKDQITKNNILEKYGIAY